MILYLISGRGFCKSNVGRKLFEVINCFNNVVETEVLFGGDIPKERRRLETEGGSSYYAKWYRRNRFVLFFSESFSELKSIVHNYLIYRYLKRENAEYSLVWERSSALHFAGLLYAKKKRIPYVLEWKDHLIKDYASFFRPLVRIVEKMKVSQSDYITVESKVLKDTLVKDGVDPSKVHITYNAVNPNEFVRDNLARKSIRAEFGILDSDYLIGYVGSYAFYHDSSRMILAAKELVNKGVSNVKWLLIGSGKDKELCTQMAKSFDIFGTTVFFVDRIKRDQVPHFLSAMDMAVLPGSTDIICPIKVMEYMAAECVAIVPDYDCNQEIIDNKNNGVLFKPFSEQSLAEAVISLVENPSQLSILGLNARQYVSEHLTWDKTYGTVLKRILADTLS